MRVELFRIGPISVPSYGVMMLIGVFLGIFMGEIRAKRYKLNSELIFDLGFWCVMGGLLGSKLLFVLLEFESIMKSQDILGSLIGGFVVYGGIIGGVLTGYIFCRIKKLNFLKYFDLIMPSVALAQGVGRIGCLLAGCCYGKVTSSRFSIMFHNTPYAPNGVPLIPTQIISSAADFLHCLILIWFARYAKKDGQVGALYLILYSIGRSLVEMLRDDPRGNVGLLSTSQFISIFMLAGGIGMFIYFSKNGKMKEANAADTVNTVNSK